MAQTLLIVLGILCFPSFFNALNTRPQTNERTNEPVRNTNAQGTPPLVISVPCFLLRVQDVIYRAVTFNAKEMGPTMKPTYSLHQNPSAPLKHREGIAAELGQHTADSLVSGKRTQFYRSLGPKRRVMRKSASMSRGTQNEANVGERSGTFAEGQSSGATEDRLATTIMSFRPTYGRSSSMPAILGNKIMEGFKRTTSEVKDEVCSRIYSHAPDTANFISGEVVTMMLSNPSVKPGQLLVDNYGLEDITMGMLQTFVTNYLDYISDQLLKLAEKCCEGVKWIVRKFYNGESNTNHGSSSSAVNCYPQSNDPNVSETDPLMDNENESSMV